MGHHKHPASDVIGLRLTRSLTPEQINARGGPRGLERFGEVREIDTAARTIELSFSSEVGYERWFGEEVLDHSPGAMRTGRLETGAAVLINHDWDDQVGVVESVSIGDDRRGRAVVRFGRSARAEEIWQDVVDGIRKHVSVGYSVHKIEVTPRKGQPDLVRVTDWEPFEISLVSVPADPTVGVGRAAENPPEEAQRAEANTDTNHRTTRTEHMKYRTYRDAQGNLCRVQVDDTGADIANTMEIVERAQGATDTSAERSAGAQAEQARVRTIMEMGARYEARDLASEAVLDPAVTPEVFQARLLDHMNRARGGALSADSGGADIGLTTREVQQYSFLRVLRALANPADRRAQQAAAFEFEAGEAAARQMNRTPEGVVVPADVLRRTLNTATSGSGDGDTGGFSVATNLLSQSFIDMLRNRSVLMQMATPMGGLVGGVTIPRQASGAAGYWIGEDDDATKDGLEMDQIGMNPKTVAALSEITRRLLMQSSLDVEALVRRDLAAALALTIDKAGFYGTGTENQPRGIANYQGINAVNFTTANAPTFAELVKMESDIASDNADVASMAYVANAAMRGYMKTATKFGTGTDQTIWETGNTVNGYRTEITNQINTGDVIFGNYADLMIGMWGGLEINVDPYTHSAKGRLRVVAMQDVDFVLRRVESFCLGRKT